jgi:hypothetical protein
MPKRKLQQKSFIWLVPDGRRFVLEVLDRLEEVVAHKRQVDLQAEGFDLRLVSWKLFWSRMQLDRARLDRSSNSNVANVLFNITDS